MSGKRRESWVRLDVGFYTHPKAIEVGSVGRDLFLALVCWSKANGTDGVIPTRSARVVSRMLDLVAPESEVERLVEVGFLHEKEFGFVLHDFEEWQETTAAIATRRAADAERKARYRDRRLRLAEESENASRDEGLLRRETRTRRATHASRTRPDTDTDTDTDN